MRDLEEQIARVVNAEVRPLVREAYRCYTAGAARAAIGLAWTAVCTDLIDKVATLAEGDEPVARQLTGKVEQARGRLDTAAVKTMQAVENEILATALDLELIDATQKLQLERLKEDRNLCAHPSLRPLGELFEPPQEYARTHLVVALDSVLVQPASQGRKVVDSFAAHLLDPSFLGDPVHVAHAFFRQVRPTARRKVVDLAARHALLELAPPDQPAEVAADLADRMAQCLRIFAAEDHELVAAMIGKFVDRWLSLGVAVQRRTLARLGDLDAFWDGVTDPMRSQLDAIVGEIGKTHRGINDWEAPDLDTVQAAVLALVAVDRARAALPALTSATQELSFGRRVQVMARRPGTYFAGEAAALLTQVGSFDSGEEAAEAVVVPCAPCYTLDQLQAVLEAWADNPQCWGRRMPDLAARLFRATEHLGAARRTAWRSFLQHLEEEAKAGTTGVIDYHAKHTQLAQAIGAELGMG
jgi:hypothetical protein